MENYTYNLLKYFPGDNISILLNKSQIHLLWFLPYAFVKGLISSKKVDVYYLCDCLIAPVGRLLKILTGKPVLATAHGLDITYNKWFYQKINVSSARSLDGIICVSQSTFDECKKRNFSSKKLSLISNGVDIEKYSGKRHKDYYRNIVEKKYNFVLKNKLVLLTVGRLVPRKGVDWFVKNVLQNLQDNIEYLIVGKGPDKQKIDCSINQLGLVKRAHLLGSISDDELKIVLNSSDLFIMPNIKVRGDCEGFGLVALEAASCGLPVIASNIEGINGAIIDRKNGFLVESGNAHEFIKLINELLKMDDREELMQKIKNYTIQNYSWRNIANQYFKKINSIVLKKSYGSN
ncbi:glycosyltransferase family 4 protein [Patescibacteria group bacterium]|nr:glycosyltransferase family 4 protein [Patescibacteria group bacterium]